MESLYKQRGSIDLNNAYNAALDDMDDDDIERKNDDYNVPINSNINKLKVNPNELDINNDWSGYSNLFGYNNEEFGGGRVELDHVAELAHGEGGIYNRDNIDHNWFAGLVTYNKDYIINENSIDNKKRLLRMNILKRFNEIGNSKVKELDRQLNAISNYNDVTSDLKKKYPNIKDEQLNKLSDINLERNIVGAEINNINMPSGIIYDGTGNLNVIEKRFIRYLRINNLDYNDGRVVDICRNHIIDLVLILNR